MPSEWLIRNLIASSFLLAATVLVWALAWLVGL